MSCRQSVSSLWSIGVFLLLVVALPGSALAEEALDPEVLVGTWKVDLRPTPDAEPYYQEFVVSKVADGSLEGTFYGSEVESGRINIDWGRVVFAFVTQDNSTTYSTSGELVEGRLEGRTHAMGRGFLAVWTAERETSATP